MGSVFKFVIVTLQFKIIIHTQKKLAKFFTGSIGFYPGFY